MLTARELISSFTTQTDPLQIIAKARHVVRKNLQLSEVSAISQPQSGWKDCSTNITLRLKYCEKTTEGLIENFLEVFFVVYTKPEHYTHRTDGTSFIPPGTAFIDHMSQIYKIIEGADCLGFVPELYAIIPQINAMVWSHVKLKTALDVYREICEEEQTLREELATYRRALPVGLVLPGRPINQCIERIRILQRNRFRIKDTVATFLGLFYRRMPNPETSDTAQLIFDGTKINFDTKITFKRLSLIIKRFGKYYDEKKIRKVAKEIAQIYRKVLKGDTPRVMSHGDLHARNVLTRIDGDALTVTFCDLKHFRIDWLYTDIIWFLTSLEMLEKLCFPSIKKNEGYYMTESIHFASVVDAYYRGDNDSLDNLEKLETKLIDLETATLNGS